MNDVGVVEDGHGAAADGPGDLPARAWRDVARRVRGEVRDDHVVLTAAGVAFFGFLALIPAMGAVVAVYGLVADPAEVQQRAGDLFASAPEEARTLLAEQMDRVVGSSGGALSLGLALSLVVALWSASSGMDHLLEALDVVYDEEPPAGGVGRRLRALLATLAAVVTLALAVGAVAVVGALVGDADLPGPLRWLARIGSYAVAALVAVAALSVLYRHGPDRDRARWRWVTPGSILDVVGWLAASVALQLYAANAGSYGATYGSLAAVVLLLLWLLVSAAVVLLGAELNAELERQTARDSTRGPEQPMGRRGATAADTLGPRHR